MNCISFPDMFTGSSTNKKYDDEATRECLYLLLNSEAGEMFGDPDFGVRLRRYFYDQNNRILRDILIDEIFTKINIFCPQIMVLRKDITLFSINKSIIGSITYKNNRDFITNTYNVVLFTGE